MKMSFSRKTVYKLELNQAYKNIYYVIKIKYQKLSNFFWVNVSCTNFTSGQVGYQIKSATFSNV